MHEWVSISAGFFGGILTALAGTWFAAWLRHRAHRARTTEDVRFWAYMKLIELKNPLFWMLSAQVRGRKPDPKFEYQAEMMSWRIADELRKADDLPEMESILRVLFSRHFASAKDRYEALSQAIEDLGKVCNPRYRQIMKRINEANMIVMQREVMAFFQGLED